MQTYSKNYAAVLIAVLGFAYTNTPTKAEFVKSDNILNVNWLDLEVDVGLIPPQTEFSAYEIVETGGDNLPIIYVLFSDFKGKRGVLGAFRCDKEFSVQKSQTNGFYDIRCIKENVFGQQTVTHLKRAKTGLYEEHF
jgi:hypothetical protein